MVSAPLVVYFIDASDEGRFEESRNELQAILRDANIPVAVLANKIDRARVSTEQIEQFFGIIPGDTRVKVFASSTGFNHIA
jgi:translation initiation factor IF-2